MRLRVTATGAANLVGADQPMQVPSNRRRRRRRRGHAPQGENTQAANLATVLPNNVTKGKLPRRRGKRHRARADTKVGTRSKTIAALQCLARPITQDARRAQQGLEVPHAQGRRRHARPRRHRRHSNGAMHALARAAPQNARRAVHLTRHCRQAHRGHHVGHGRQRRQGAGAGALHARVGHRGERRHGAAALQAREAHRGEAPRGREVWARRAVEAGRGDGRQRRQHAGALGAAEAGCLHWMQVNRQGVPLRRGRQGHVHQN
mmetsp:Transcript_68644/g.210457  ORF Transcript_68644/g.210457 Transcript_68644/m.210457 type:complete len:262 (-) Transcript_68644:342-1127(-)